MRPGLAKILKDVSEQKAKEDKINLLRYYDSPALRTIISLAYDPAIEWILPDGDPPYKQCDYLDQESRLYSELRRFYLFIKGGNDNIKSEKRETLFINLLESIDKEDAKLVLAMKSRKLPYKLTLSLIKEAFPDIDYGQIQA